MRRYVMTALVFYSRPYSMGLLSFNWKLVYGQFQHAGRSPSSAIIFHFGLLPAALQSRMTSVRASCCLLRAHVPDASSKMACLLVSHCRGQEVSTAKHFNDTRGPIVIVHKSSSQNRWPLKDRCVIHNLPLDLISDMRHYCLFPFPESRSLRICSAIICAISNNGGNFPSSTFYAEILSEMMVAKAPGHSENNCNDRHSAQARGSRHALKRPSES